MYGVQGVASSNPAVPTKYSRRVTVNSVALFVFGGAFPSTQGERRDAIRLLSHSLKWPSICYLGGILPGAARGGKRFGSLKREAVMQASAGQGVLAVSISFPRS